MMYKAKVAVCSVIRTKHSTQSERHVEFLNVKPWWNLKKPLGGWKVKLNDIKWRKTELIAVADLRTQNHASKKILNRNVEWKSSLAYRKSDNYKYNTASDF
jgi:hypothetical protein